jgi:hypothetical protein
VGLGIDGHEGDVVARLHLRVQGLGGEYQLQAGWAHDGERLLAALQVQGAEQPKQPKIMVAVQVRDKNHPERAQAAAVL